MQQRIIKNNDGGYFSFWESTAKDLVKAEQEFDSAVKDYWASRCDVCIGKETSNNLCEDHKQVYDKYRWDN